MSEKKHAYSWSAPPRLQAVEQPLSEVKINLNTMSPHKLLLALSARSGVNYQAIFIHCLIFNEDGESLLIRHPDNMSSDIVGPGGFPLNPGSFHQPDHWCSPAVTCEMYVDIEDATGPTSATSEDANTPLSVVEWVKLVLPSFVLGQSRKLLCVLDTAMTHVRDKLPSVASGREDEKQYPVLVLAVGGRSYGGPVASLRSMSKKDRWVSAETAGKMESRCSACCGQWVFPEAVRQWQQRDKSFDRRDAWFECCREGEGCRSGAGGLFWTTGRRQILRPLVHRVERSTGA